MPEWNAWSDPMNVGSANWNWRGIEALLEGLAAADDELIVCGGQAVAFWSQRYGLSPITSRESAIARTPCA